MNGLLPMAPPHALKVRRRFRTVRYDVRGSGNIAAARAKLSSPAYY